MLVVGEFKGAGHMRLDVVGAPNALDGRFGNARALGHGPNRPARPVGGWLRRAHDDFFSHLCVKPGLTPTPFGFGQASQAGLRKAPFPFDDYRARHADFVGGFHLAEAIGTVKDNPRTPVLAITGGGAIDGGA